MQNAKRNISIIMIFIVTLQLTYPLTYTLDAQTKSLLDTGGSYLGKANETPANAKGLYIEEGGEPVLQSAVTINSNGIQSASTADRGLKIVESSIDISYSSGSHLTRDNKAYVTIPVFNNSTEANYDNVRVKYAGSQHDALNVNSKTGAKDIDAKSGSGLPEDSAIDYVFEVTLKDDVLGYVNYSEVFANQDKGHAPLTEDLEFEISAVESIPAAKDPSTGAVTPASTERISETFFLGKPDTESDGAIALGYDQDAIEVEPTEETKDVCYNGYSRADYTITNNGSEFIYINSSEFENNDEALTGMVTENGGELTFLFNDVDLTPYWTGEEDMYANMEYDQWQTFTINPGESAKVSIIAEGESLEDYEEQSLPAKIILPMSDYNSDSTDQDIVLTMNYYYNKEDPECELSGNEDTEGDTTDNTEDDSTDSESTNDESTNDENVQNGTGSTASLTNTASTSFLPLAVLAMGSVVVLKNKIIK